MKTAVYLRGLSDKRGETHYKFDKNAHEALIFRPPCAGHLSHMLYCE